jgi:hypothetical protein
VGVCTVRIGFVMCGCFGNIYTCFVYVYLFLFVLSGLVYGLIPPSENAVAVNNSNNNNNNNSKTLNAEDENYRLSRKVG